MSVPQRWLNCPRKSQIIAEKFLAFKTPLGPRYDDEIPEANRFQLPMLFAYLQSLQMRLGLIIDLTNTNRFYDKTVVERTGIKHIKMQLKGHRETPSKEQVALFIRMCDRYFDQNPGELIGVHCTHGFNRTGFLIVAYLVEKDDWSIEAAIHCFAQCRPPGIYKAHYLQDLVKRYGDSNESIAAPELPDWCYDEEEGLSDNEEENGRTVEDGSHSDGRRKKMRRDPRLKEAKFMDEVEGIEVVNSPRREDIQEICEKMCAWESGGFPGSQPVSMDVQNIKLLHEKPYRVSWKADGVRYMMLILKEREIYLIDRDNNVFAAPQFHFPQRKNLREHIFDTLIDGEMVLDKENEKVHPRYLAYDIVRFQGQEVGKQSHDIRMICIEKEIEVARNQAAQQGLLDKSKEPFSIRAKKFFPVEKAEWVLENWSPKLCHENDGLIFNPAEEPYEAGQSSELLKWKPHTLNSVDFVLNIRTVRQEGCIPESVGALMVGGFDRPFAQIKVTKELKSLDKKVVECTWDAKNKQWKFLRVREDKSFPNGYKTAMSVCKSIQQPVTKKWLLEVIEKHRYHSVRHRDPNAPSTSHAAV